MTTFIFPAPLSIVLEMTTDTVHYKSFVRFGKLACPLGPV